MASDRETVEALARKYHDPKAGARAFGLALAHAESSRYHLNITAKPSALLQPLRQDEEV